MSARKNYDIEMQHLQTLSQKLAQKYPILSDFACNADAVKLAELDAKIQPLIEKWKEKDPTFVAQLLQFREYIKLRGEARWIQGADNLTNLGLKLGATGRKEPLYGSK